MYKKSLRTNVLPQAVIISVYFFGMVTILARELPSDDEVRPCITSDSEFFNSTSGQHNATLDSMNCATTAGLDYNTVEFVFSIFPIMPAMKVIPSANPCSPLKTFFLIQVFCS